MKETIKKLIKKFAARKFLAMIAGVIVGLCLIFGADESDIAGISGALTSCVSLVVYIVTEGKLDYAAIEAENENKNDE